MLGVPDLRLAVDRRSGPAGVLGARGREQFLAAIHSPTESDRPVDRGGLRVASAGSRNVRPRGALFTIIFPAVPGLWVIVAKVQ